MIQRIVQLLNPWNVHQEPLKLKPHRLPPMPAAGGQVIGQVCTGTHSARLRTANTELRGGHVEFDVWGYEPFCGMAV